MRTALRSVGPTYRQPIAGLPIVDLPRFAFVQHWDLQNSFAYCTQIARQHYENFPVASLLIPKPLRPYIAAVYAFARAADDFADEAEFAEARLALLTNWQNALELAATREINHPVFIAINATIKKFAVPSQLFIDLITAFKMDVVKHDYETFDEVLHYCRHSANPVGRIVLWLFGYHEEKYLQLSDNICTGLQLANFWQDVAVDLAKPRVYLPNEDLERFGYSVQELRQHHYNERFVALLRFQVERASQFLRQGQPLASLVRGRLAWELRLTCLGGLQVLKKIEQLQYNVLQTRPHLSVWDKSLLVLSSLP